jgi:hypothetical protein
MQYVLGNMLNGGGGLNPDGLSLDLQFAADKTLTARKGPTPVFTRASTATFVGSNGLIQSAAINIPRFDHNPTSPFACRGLLIEESRTNLLSRSEDFANSTWIKSNSSISGTLYTAPTGASTANELVEDSLNAAHTCVQNAATATIGTTYTFSVFVKRKPSSNQFLLIGATNLVVASFLSVNLTNGVTSTGIGSPGVPINVSSTNYPDDWYRVQFSVVATSAAATTLDIRLSRDGTWTNRSYLGDGVQSSLIWGAQVEAGSFPTSYIPTTTSSLARSADVCSITGANFTGFTKLGEGSVVVHGDSYQGTTPAFCQFSNDTNGSRSFNFQRNSSTGALEHSDSGAGVMTVSASPSFPVKFGAARNQTIGVKLFYNGVAGASSVFTTNGVQTRMLIGNSGIGLPLNGCIRSIKHFKKRLSDAKMQTLTAP